MGYLSLNDFQMVFVFSISEIVHFLFLLENLLFFSQKKLDLIKVVNRALVFLGCVSNGFFAWHSSKRSKIGVFQEIYRFFWKKIYENAKIGNFRLEGVSKGNIA